MCIQSVRLSSAKCRISMFSCTYQQQTQGQCGFRVPKFLAIGARIVARPARAGLCSSVDGLRSINGAPRVLEGSNAAHTSMLMALRVVSHSPRPGADIALQSRTDAMRATRESAAPERTEQLRIPLQRGIASPQITLMLVRRIPGGPDRAEDLWGSALPRIPRHLAR